MKTKETLQWFGAILASMSIFSVGIIATMGILFNKKILITIIILVTITSYLLARKLQSLPSTKNPGFLSGFFN